MPVAGATENLDPDEMTLLALALLRLANDPSSEVLLRQRVELIAKKLKVDKVCEAIVAEMPKS